MRRENIFFRCVLLSLIIFCISTQKIKAQVVDTIYAIDEILAIEVLKDNPGNIILSGTITCASKTTDFGQNWLAATFDTVAYCYDLSFNPQNTDTGFLSALTNLFKTTDGGYTWFTLGNLNSPYFVDVNPYFPNIIFVWGTEDPGLGPSHFYRSFDGGTMWQDSIGDLVILDPVFHPDSSNIAYAHSAYQVLKTTDTGETWSPILGTATTWIEKLWLNPKNPDVIYAGGKQVLYKTMNGGIDWERIDSELIEMDPYIVITSILGDENFPGRLYIGSGHSYLEKKKFNLGDEIKGLFLTEDYGISWTQIYNQEISIIEADNENPRNIYCGTNFGVIKLVDTFSVTGISEISNTVPYKFGLYQNYPNPFNPSTKIKYQIDKESLVQLNVYDVLGNEVARLVNEYKAVGSYAVDFNASQLSSGIYFYKLQAGSFVETKKMILLR